MTPAQEQLAELVAWVSESSKDVPAPLGRDRVVCGPFAVVVSQGLSLPPGPAFPPEHLPLWVPEEQTIPGLPSFDQPAPVQRGRMDSRLQHLVWKWQDGWFKGALLGLTDPTEPLQDALDRQLTGLDLAEHLALFAPLWTLEPEYRNWIARNLPVLSK